MDEAERLVEDLLHREGFRAICHEPNGASTYPDFSVAGNIAVEVRRLNQFHVGQESAEDLQDASIRVQQRIERLCVELGQGDGNSWFVCYRFSRPLPQWKHLIPRLEAAMRAFMASGDRRGCRLFEDSNFELDVIPASDRLETFFRLGAMHDMQSGGFVVAEFIRSIELCAEKKVAKKAKCPVAYQASWLVLVNTSGLRLDAYDKQMLLDNCERPAQWDRVLVVRAMTKADEWFELR